MIKKKMKPVTSGVLLKKAGPCGGGKFLPLSEAPTLSSAADRVQCTWSGGYQCDLEFPGHADNCDLVISTMSNKRRECENHILRIRQGLSGKG